MPERSVDSVLARLGSAIAKRDAGAALRRARELQTLVAHLPSDALPQVRARLSALLEEADALRDHCAGAVRKARTQRQNVVVYRSFAGHS